MKKPFPRRAIHLDFHTGLAIPHVGQDFRPDHFAQTFAKAHVDSVTVFAKCHHGHLYYDTEDPARHPNLPRSLNLLGEQIDALHQAGIKAPIYVSVQCDEFAADTHPEWIALDPEGKQVKWGGRFEASWQILDMSSPYQDYLAEQLAEILRLFAPTDGIFLDMCWDQPSCSRWAVAGMARLRLNPQNAADRDQYARLVAHQYMARFKKMVDQAHRGHAPAGIWFNSRPKTNLHEERKFLRHIEVECLPTGGWGYAYFPYVARFVRPFGLPTLAMTARFHKSWADFGGLKPEAALKYECCQALSQGLSNSIGDQMHPRGVLDRAAYAMIGRVYEYIQSCEPWTEEGKILSQVGVIIDPQKGDHAGPDGLGAIRALQQLRYQFDLLPPNADLDAYECILVPDFIRIDTTLRERLKIFVHNGGALLLSGSAALTEDGAPLLEEMGVQTHGESPYTVTYLRANPCVDEPLSDTDHVMYERGFRMTPLPGSTVIAHVVEPYFERAFDHFCSHNQTPPDRLSRYASVVQNGRVITFAVPIFSAYGKHGNIVYRQFLATALERLLPRPLLRDNGPSHLETSVLRKGRRTIVHLISFCPARRTETLDIVEEPFPIVDMTLSVRLDTVPRKATLAPSGEPVDVFYIDGYAQVKVTVLTGHAMLVFD